MGGTPNSPRTFSMAAGRAAVPRRIRDAAQLMRARKTTRAAASIVAIMLAGGFLYSGVASIRLLRELFQRAPSPGRTASVDAYLAPVNLSSSGEFRRAVRCLWPSDDAIDVVGEAPLSQLQIQQ